MSIKDALSNIDWGQVVANGGPPCFFVEEERGKFCLRAERWQGHGVDHNYVPLAETLNAAVEAAIRAEVSHPRYSEWINVEDRLPSEGEDLLAFGYVAAYQTEPYVCVAFRDHGKWLADDFTLKVTHWMPLPEPPK